eukprot:EST43626.1 hypothetical protein SS50377_16669 [Spironucleus salmonicida]
MENEFFDACKQGNCIKIQDLLPQISSKRESREFYFQGFAGIHYAAYYGQLEAFQLLFDHQKHMKTINEIMVVSKQHDYIHSLPPKLNCLELAIINAKLEVIKYISTIFQQNYGLFLKNKTQKRRLIQLLQKGNNQIQKFVQQEILEQFKVQKVKDGSLLCEFQ